WSLWPSTVLSARPRRCKRTSANGWNRPSGHSGRDCLWRAGRKGCRQEAAVESSDRRGPGRGDAMIPALRIRRSTLERRCARACGEPPPVLSVCPVKVATAGSAQLARSFLLVADREVGHVLQTLDQRRVVPAAAADRRIGAEHLLRISGVGQVQAQFARTGQGQVEVLLVQADAEARIEGA